MKIYLFLALPSFLHRHTAFGHDLVASVHLPGNEKRSSDASVNHGYEQDEIASSSMTGTDGTSFMSSSDVAVPGNLPDDHVDSLPGTNANVDEVVAADFRDVDFGKENLNHMRTEASFGHLAGAQPEAAVQPVAKTREAADARLGSHYDPNPDLETYLDNHEDIASTKKASLRGIVENSDSLVSRTLAPEGGDDVTDPQFELDYGTNLTSLSNTNGNFEEKEVINVKNQVDSDSRDNVDPSLKQKQRRLNYELLSSGYGDILTCGSQTALSQICTGGKYKDCKGGTRSTSGFCSNTKLDGSTTWYGGDWNVAAVSCPSGRIGSGFCGGGSERDCQIYSNYKNSFGLRCEGVRGGTVGFTVEKCCNKGEDCACGTDSFVTSLCASGADANCPCQGRDVYTAIKCARITCNAGHAMTHYGCEQCSGGYYSSFAGSACSACNAGQYADYSGATSCKQCSPGTYSNSGGQSYCYRCGAGSFQAGHGATKCDLCPAGKYSSGSGATSCDTCPDGKVSLEGASACVACPEGTSVSSDKRSCVDIDECAKTDNGGCPKPNSKCVNIEKSLEKGTGWGFKCQCVPGFGSKNSWGTLVTEGDTSINCQAQPTGLMVVRRSYENFAIKTTSAPLNSYDVRVSRYVTLGDSLEISNSPFTVPRANLLGGYEIPSLDPGTNYKIELMAAGGTLPIETSVVKTTCECNNGVTDSPGSLQIVQNKGLMMFEFVDMSRCEEGFDFFREGPYLPNQGRTGISQSVFTSTYFYGSAASCREAIKPGKQVSDDLKISKLGVGKLYYYCVRAVGEGTGGIKYFSAPPTCQSITVNWEASIDGVVKLAPDAGSIPVRDVTVMYNLISKTGTSIKSGSTITDQSGKYSIVFNERHQDLDDTTGFEVRVSFSKTTIAAHTFLCDDGKVDCSGTNYTKVFLKHLNFDVEHSAIDDSSVPVRGKVLIAGTGRSVDMTNPMNFEVHPETQCPLIGAKVCITILNVRDQDGEKSCVDVDSSGNFQIGAPIGALVHLDVDYYNHTFILDKK